MIHDTFLCDKITASYSSFGRSARSLYSEQNSLDGVNHLFGSSTSVAQSSLAHISETNTYTGVQDLWEGGCLGSLRKSYDVLGSFMMS